MNLFPRLPEGGEPTKIRRRALAGYLGLAVGDALGATTEFLRPQEIVARYGLHQEITGGGWLNLKPGRVTDDTEMNLALGKALVERQGFDVTAVGQAFSDWMSSKPVDIGSTIRQGLKAFRRDGTTVQEENEYHGGNGAAMRLYPLVLATLTRPESFEPWAIAQAHLTHNHKESDAGILMIGALSRAAILLGQAAPLGQMILDWTERYPQFSPKLFKGSYDGYIVNSIRCVLYYFNNTGSFEDCLVKIANAGGDTDTNAVLAGMIAGPFYGLEGLPSRWLKKLERTVRGQIETQVQDLFAIFNPQLAEPHSQPF